MKLLLTSSGISNASIHQALVDMLGKPVAESRALFIPTAIYPFPNSAEWAWRAVHGTVGSPLALLGWSSAGLLELTALPSIDRDVWEPMIEETDALLVWGGDPLYLSHWLRESGLAELLRSMRRPPVYVGVSAGSIATSALFAETYPNRRRGAGSAISSEPIMFTTPEGNTESTLVTAHGAGFVDFAIIPHLEHPDHRDASLSNAAIWAAKLPVPVYAIDDQTAVRVVDGAVDVVSEGQWKLFNR